MKTRAVIMESEHWSVSKFQSCNPGMDAALGWVQKEGKLILNYPIMVNSQ